MEGIAGTYGHEDRELVRRMLGRLRHRGPGSSMTHTGNRFALGARALALRPREKRKAILEEDGIAVAVDSCIFNREPLAEGFAPDLEDRPFTDAELVHRMYRAVGVKAFDYLDGAFATAIVDNGRTVLARDRYGLKPLYLSGGARTGSFSSEIKSQVLAEKDFVPFPPGKVLRQGRGFSSIRPKRMWPKRTLRKGEPEKDLKELLLDSVRVSTEGQTSLSMLLSGGIDSSAIAAAASSLVPDLNTVCVGFPGGVDIDMARMVADNIGSKHREMIYTVEDMLGILDDVIYASETFDYPLVRSCIPNYMATHAFDGPNRVALCGEGGDEIFAGYDYMRGIKSNAALATERKALLSGGWKTGFQRVDRMNASASLDGRMPLMDGRVIDLGLKLGWKHLGRTPNTCKLVLRKAFGDLLPKEVMNRRKQRFSDGAGSITALVKVSEQLISDTEFQKERRALPKGRIRTKEELMYYRIFRKHFPSASAAAAVGFTPRP